MSAASRSERVPPARAQTPLVFRLVTWGVPLFLLALSLVPGVPDSPAEARWVSVFAVVLLLFFLLAPRRLAYTLTPEALVISRLTGRTALPYTGITARRSAGRLGVRLFGTGMPGYLTGLFSFGPDAVSRVQAAASRTRDGVIVERGGTAFFLTPADPEAFLHSLAARGVRAGA